MRTPGTLFAPVVPVACLQRMIFTPEGQHTVYERALPQVLHGCWESADGRRLLALANYTRKPADVVFDGAEGRLTETVPARSFTACIL
jgi:hypothetical protein